jgi:hypothetical protein
MFTIKDQNVRNALIHFYGSKETEYANNLRNSFTHRFPMNQSDYRSIIIEENGIESMGLGNGEFIPPEKIIQNIKNSMSSLSILMEKLKESIN